MDALLQAVRGGPSRALGRRAAVRRPSPPPTPKPSTSDVSINHWATIGYGPWSPLGRLPPAPPHDDFLSESSRSPSGSPPTRRRTSSTQKLVEFEPDSSFAKLPDSRRFLGGAVRG